MAAVWAFLVDLLSGWLAARADRMSLRGAAAVFIAAVVLLVIALVLVVREAG